MTTTTERRIAALEAATDTDKLVLLFMSWTPSDAIPRRRLTTEWKGERFNQEPDESEDSFRDRVRGAVNRNRPAANCAAVVWVNEVDWAL